ncbi:hypothetical protein QA635_03935 [Bradyrhizobium brasilense]|uniref:hypothetical protein n=1 Tax=Bradyrhizobium brasilense TaxID=1419277 RepID=UPI0024B0D2DD|nr:hypothetical protein [Bradyrhizobium australafricanum]WFU33609.1 hypothetical protein QA635_03935 [Bradyrhizobium australafricanum]
MPLFTIETTYHLPVRRQRTYDAETLDQACGLAIADEGWDGNKSDVETSGETYVTGAWEGRDAAYVSRPLPFPSRFDEQVQRKANHFELLLGLLKILAAPEGGSVGVELWRRRADAAIAKAEAILAGEDDPIEGAAS